MGDSVSSLTTRVAGWVKLGHDGLQDYRVHLMAEVRKMLDTQDIRGPRQLGAKLKQLKIKFSENGIDSDPILAEFVRFVLLSGNGTLLINNTFVEWATIQAVRRARPSLMVISFGIRNNSANPIPTQMDTLDSYVDLEIFNYYLWLEFEKYVEYRRNTVYLFVGVGMDEMLVIAPPDFSMMAKQGPVKPAEVFSSAKEWMNLGTS